MLFFCYIINSASSGRFVPAVPATGAKDTSKAEFANALRCRPADSGPGAIRGCQFAPVYLPGIQRTDTAGRRHDTPAGYRRKLANKQRW